jgi:hypothetical protein
MTKQPTEHLQYKQCNSRLALACTKRRNGIHMDRKLVALGDLPEPASRRRQNASGSEQGAALGSASGRDE